MISDARGKTTCLYYDGYGRLRGKHFRTNTSCPGSVSSYDVRYTYDQHHGSANRSRGQLTQVYYQRSGGYYKNLYYNSQGLLVREQVRIPGQGLLNSWYGYDRYQRPTTLTYPDGEVVTTWYNSMGLPAKLHSNRLGNLVDGEVDVSTVDGAMGYVEYDAAGRLTNMRMPHGTDLWRRQGYYGWTSSSKPNYGGGNGRLYYIFVGTSSGAANKLNLNYAYDSFGNIRQHHDNHGYHSFGYDEQNRLTSAYGQSYGYDSAGRLTHYEGNRYTSYTGHAIRKSGYSYDANGNLTNRFGRVLVWNHENRLDYVRYGSVIQEQYLYDDQGIRVKKTVGGVATYYPFAHYEVAGNTAVKYYFFNGQRVAMKRGSTFSYLHTDHLGSTVLETNTAGHVSADQRYRAYGNQRDNGPVVTDHRFTGQKYDSTGLY